MYSCFTSTKNIDSLKLLEMQDLLRKERELHKKILANSKKINQKINLDFRQIEKLRTK